MIIKRFPGWQMNCTRVNMTTEAVVRNNSILVSCNSIWRSRDSHRDASQFNSIIPNWCLSSVMVKDIESWDRKPVDDDGEENKPVDNRAHRTNEVCLLFIAFTVVGKQMSSMLNVE